MRMWKVDPKVLCRKHLLGEHVEMHMFVGAILKGTSLRGYIDKGLVETDKIKQRHDDLAKEMIRRGYKHCSPIEQVDCKAEGQINTAKAAEELLNRCPECAKRMYDLLFNLDPDSTI